MNAQISPMRSTVAIWSGRYDVATSDPAYNMHYLSLDEVKTLLSDERALGLMDNRYYEILKWAYSVLSAGDVL